MKQLAVVVVFEVSKNKKEEEVAIGGGGGFRSFLELVVSILNSIYFMKNSLREQVWRRRRKL